jgi:hypothetical protein
MEKDISEIIQNASRTWLNAAEALGIRIIAPFSILIDSVNIQCIAFVPEFGGPNGAIVGVLHPETFAIDIRLKEYAKRHEFFLSSINPLGWIKYDEAIFKDALEDWGYYGAQDKCPSWFKGFKYGKALP